MHKYTWKHEGTTYSAYYGERAYFGNHYYISDLYDLTENEEPNYEYSPADILQPTIASWYLALRNIALVALLSILVYIGIRITLTSIAGDKAKYKQMLIDWVVAIALVFLMHYIMSFAVTINELIIDGIKGITVSGYGSQNDVVDKNNKKIDVKTQETSKSRQSTTTTSDQDDKVAAAGVELFVISDSDAVKRAYKTLVDPTDPKSSPFYNKFEFDSNKNPITLYWPANDFMAQARMLGQDIGENQTQTKVARAGYNIIYVVLVIYTVIFCFTYLKRVIYMAFLTLMAPLVAITYPIDKVSDGKAQAFDMWLKEYIFNLLMQPMHLILYTILVGMAMKFASNNIFYAVIAIGFLVPAEKILRRFFRFERAQTPGIFEGTAGAALMMSGINRLMHRSPNKSKLGPGVNSDKEDKENSKISTYKNGEDPFSGLTGEDKPVRTMNQGKDEKENGDKDTKEQEYNVQNPIGSEKYKFTGGTTTTSSSSDDKRGEKTGKGEVKKPEKEEKSKRKLKKHPGRMIRRGINAYGRGIQRRYKANKRLKGGLVRRTLRTTTGVVAAGTMAAAGGIIGIATGDASKAAQYMAAGAAGGYKLGKAGVNKTANKLKEQYSEPLEQAKKGYYGEEEYEKREHEKWKKREFEQNSENIQKVQEAYNLNWKQAKEKSKQIAEFTDVKGINSFDKALAAYKITDEGGGKYSNEESKVIGNLVNGRLDGKGANKLNREERQGLTQDLIDKLMKSGYNSNDAKKQAERLIKGTSEYAKNLK